MIVSISQSSLLAQLSKAKGSGQCCGIVLKAKVMMALQALQCCNKNGWRSSWHDYPLASKGDW
jgi:hypothetical protein